MAFWLCRFLYCEKEASERCGIMPGMAAFFSQLPLVI